MIHPYQLHLLSKLYHERALCTGHECATLGIGRKRPAGRARRKSRGFGPG